MLSLLGVYNKSFHDVFVNSVWNLEKIKNYFGDAPTILINVLKRRSCSIDVVQLLLKEGADINCEDEFGYTPLMIALEISNSEAVIRLLLESGAEVNKVDTRGRTPLLGFLQRKNCSVGIVEVLLDFKADVNHTDVYGDSPLTIAILTSQDEAVIRVLVERGAQVHSVNQSGDTPLHCAVRNNTSVINLLLRNGSPVNARNKSDETPLMLAVKVQRPAIILKDLLIAGAYIGKTKFCHGDFCIKYELLEFLKRQCERCWDRKTLDSYKMLVKFFLLESSECEIGNLECTPPVLNRCKRKLLYFMNKCVSELGQMDSLQIGNGLTFRMFVSRYCLSVEKSYDLNQILVCMMKNTFHFYFDVISARIGRSIMEEEISKLQVSTNRIRRNLLDVERICLNSNVVLTISEYLTDDDLLKFILAFYKPVNREASKDDILLGKRNSELTYKPSKNLKLYR